MPRLWEALIMRASMIGAATAASACHSTRKFAPRPPAVFDFSMTILLACERRERHRFRHVVLNQLSRRVVVVDSRDRDRTVGVEDTDNREFSPFLSVHIRVIRGLKTSLFFLCDPPRLGGKKVRMVGLAGSPHPTRSRILRAKNENTV